MNQFRVAGFILVATSLGFVAVFSYLAARFGYPEVLDGSADHVLPALAAGGAKMRWAWVAYAALPSGITLTAILTRPLLSRAGDTVARLGTLAAVSTTLAMTAGLMRWPTIHHTLAQRYLVASAEERNLLSALFDAANLYLGNVTGEFIGEICLCLWFAATSYALLKHSANTGSSSPRWVAYLGFATAASMSIGALRNVTSAVNGLAEFNNSLLPIWLVILGVTFARISPHSSSFSSERKRLHGIAVAADVVCGGQSAP